MAEASIGPKPFAKECEVFGLSLEEVLFKDLVAGLGTDELQLACEGLLPLVLAFAVATDFKNAVLPHLLENVLAHTVVIDCVLPQLLHSLHYVLDLLRRYRS